MSAALMARVSESVSVMLYKHMWATGYLQGNLHIPGQPNPARWTLDGPQSSEQQVVCMIVRMRFHGEGCRTIHDR